MPTALVRVILAASTAGEIGALVAAQRVVGDGARLSASGRSTMATGTCFSAPISGAAVL